MKLNPGFAQEYKDRHDKIWPGLKSLLKKVGVSDYSIFLDKETDTLFATLKVGNVELFERLSSIELMKTWWSHMSDIMEVNEDKSPVSIPMEEVFYLR